MATIGGSNIVTSGLILSLDAANSRSYPGSGTTWFDVSGNDNHFTLFNSPSYNTLGYFVLDGVDDYIRSTNTLNLSNTSTLTIDISIKINSYPNSAPVDIVYEHTPDFNSSTGGLVHSYNDNSLGQSFQVFLSNRGSAGYNIGYWDKSVYNDLSWKNSIAVYDRTQALVENILYLQGTLVSGISNPAVGTAFNNTNNFADSNFFIGSRAGSLYFANMNVSYIKIYNRVLSASEVFQNYNSQKSRFGL
jgi:hypothetical protein